MAVNQNNFDTPKVVTNIINNTSFTPPLQGTAYAGIYSSNRGPAYKYYSSQSDLESWAGLENPYTTLGLGSVSDLLTQSSNVLAVRILQPYAASTNPTGDAYAYALYTNTGWKTPTIKIGDNAAYPFTSNDCFIITGTAQGTYYNLVNVQVVKSSTASGYNIYVYDENGVQQESYYVTFEINEDGSNQDTFAEAVVNVQSKYIQIFVNYVYFINKGNGVLPDGYYTSSYPSSGVSSVLTWNATRAFTKYTNVYDAYSNIYISCGQLQTLNGANVESTFNTSIVQYNSSNNTWLLLPNTNNSFSFIQSGADSLVASVYSPSNSGTIYSFLRSGGVDALVDTLSAGASVVNIGYNNAFNGYTVVIEYNTTDTKWEVLVDGVSVHQLSPGSGTYNAGGLSFTYHGLTTTTTGRIQFYSNRLSCLTYTLSDYKYTNVGLIGSGGFLLPTNLNIQSGIALSNGNLLLVGNNSTTKVTIFYYYNVKTNTVISTPSSFSYGNNLKLLQSNNGTIYSLGGYNPITSTYDRGINSVTYSVNSSETTLSVHLIELMKTPNLTGFNGSATGILDNYIYSYGGSSSDNVTLNGEFYVFDLNLNQVVNHATLATYATISNGLNGVKSTFIGDFIPTSTGVITALGSTNIGQYNGVIEVSSSLIGKQQLTLGQNAPNISDLAVINTLAQLYDTVQFPLISVLADCGFNSTAVALAGNALMASRHDGVFLLSMPRSYERSEEAAVLYRQNININNGYTFLSSPGEYVRINRLTGVYELFPISGAIGADLAKQDNQNGPWQSPAGPTNGLLDVVIKLPPQKVGTPLVVPYKEISYLNTDLMGANQVNIVGRYTSQYPGVYLKNDRLLDSTDNLLQSISVKRLVLYIASNSQTMAQRFLFKPNNGLTRTEAYTLFDDWLSLLLNQNGSIYTYQVVCDSSNNSAITVNQGILNIDIIVYPIPVIRGIVINIIANKVDNTISISTASVSGGNS